MKGRIQELEYRIQEKSNVTEKIAVVTNRRHCDVVLSVNQHKKKGPTVAAEPFVNIFYSHEGTKAPGKSILNADKNLLNLKNSAYGFKALNPESFFAFDLIRVHLRSYALICG